MEHKYFITFGQKSPFRDGWVELVVEQPVDEGHLFNVVKEEVEHAFGPTGYASWYDEEQFDESTKAMYPDGKIGKTITV